MAITQEPFGETEAGLAVELFTLTNAHGLVAKITNFGGILTSLQTPSRDGKLGEITMGFDSLAGYQGTHPYFGATVGRVANRIAGGQFTLDDKTYTLAKNGDGVNHVHGGDVGFDKVIWNATPIETDAGPSLVLEYLSKDGEEGYPGNLTVRVTYTLNDDDELRIDYLARTDKPTPVNLTNHTYFNLADGGACDVLKHVLTINADKCLAVGEDLMPSGKIDPIADGPLDFRQPREIGQRIDEAGGYDHCYVINRPGEEDPAERQFVSAATVFEPTTGRVMEVLTTEPGVQLYTGNFLDGLPGRGGVAYNKHCAFCLETQQFPDAPNQPGFPDITLRPGQDYTHSTIHKFSVRE